MIARVSAAALLSFSLLCTPVGAQDQEPAKQEKKICRTSKMTGSLTRRSRICLTAAQWRELNDRTRKGVDEMVGGASGGKECIMDAVGGCQVGGFPPAPANQSP
jgi:hypothetical protein